MTERAHAGVLASVLLGAVLVGGGALLWVRLALDEIPPGLALTMTFGLVAALAIGQIASPRLQPRVPMLRDLARRIEAANAPISEGTDPVVGEIARAVNRLSERARLAVESAERAASVGRTAVQASPNGVLLVDLEGRVRLLNDAFRLLCDVAPGDAVGRPMIEVLHIADVLYAIEQCRQGRAVDEVAARVGRTDLVIRAVRVEDGVLVIAQDVTRFRMAERARTDFVANVSHELRTPIATIMGYAETLGSDRDSMNEEDASMADAILRNARRLRDLFEDLLELSRIESRRGELPRAREALLPILVEASASARDLAHQRRQDFAVECAGDLEAWVNAEALETIVSNLATNASNYTSDGGRVRVVARAQGEEVVVDVIDNGIGIDRAHHERIFERFYRVDVGRSRKAGGTGLGLAIAKHLAIASGSRVTMSSEPGKGSTFTVHLAPATRGSAPPATAGSAPT